MFSSGGKGVSHALRGGHRLIRAFHGRTLVMRLGVRVAARPGRRVRARVVVGGAVKRGIRDMPGRTDLAVVGVTLYPERR